MNLRTIQLYALYDPKRRLVIEFRRYKKDIKPMDGCVIVRLKGYYIPPRGDNGG